MKDLVILGAGGHGKVTADLARACGYQPRAFVDMGRVGEIAEPGGTRIELEQSAFLEFVKAQDFVFGPNATIAIGNNTVRLNLFFELKPHMNLPTLVHPTASVSPSAELGLGTHVCPMVVVHSAAWVGQATILNTRCIVEHDCVIGDGVHISPGAVLCGGVHVGDGAWVGAGAVVIPGIRIGENAIVGAGAVVIRDVPAGVTVVGNPARCMG